MGVYINGMKMPTSCLACQLERHQDTSYDYEFRCCPVTGEQTNRYRRERHQNCPLVPVPEHGDLIDRNETIKALWKALYEYEDRTEKQFVESSELDVADWILHRIFVQNMSDIDRQTILQMPTIIPAEEGDYS